MRNQRLAEQYVAQGKVISQAEYDRTFGATQAQVDKVATWLRSRGVTVTSVDRVSGAVQARAPVSTMQRALRTTLATAQLDGHRGLVPYDGAGRPRLARRELRRRAQHHGADHAAPRLACPRWLPRGGALDGVVAPRDRHAQHGR